MNSVALLLLVAVAAVSAQQPLFRVTANQPFQQAQPQQFQQFQPQQYQRRPVAVQPFQQPYYRRPVYRQDATPAAVIPIVSQTDVRDDKGYTYSYKTGDNTEVQERGLLKPGPEGDYIVAEGSFSFVGTDGVTYTITYKADENGFQAEGAHIPKVPEALKK